jgi:ABC-type transport system involved in cytochrome bd biosynthesis fused ATPase/permease subunit
LIGLKQNQANARKEKFLRILNLIEKHPELTENQIKGNMMITTGDSFASIGAVIEDLVAGELVDREGEYLKTYRIRRGGK